MIIYIENAVRGFSRYHKYTLGEDLRDLSRSVVRLVIRANSERDRLSTLRHLRDTIEELKVVIRVCKEVKALKDFNTFKYLIEEAISLSRQSEGWIKSMKGRGLHKTVERVYYLHLDIRNFFMTIDKAVLCRIVEKKERLPVMKIIKKREG